MIDLEVKNHWNKVYGSTEITKLGWYEKMPSQCIRLLELCNLDGNDLILDVGAGASTFIDTLISNDFNNIIATDISEVALEHLKNCLGSEKSSKVKYIVDDITMPQFIKDLHTVKLWHDRAVLHFLTEEERRQGYLKTLKDIVKQDGYVMIAVFSLDGVKKCSGLDVKRYDENLLSEFLGEEFKLIEYFNYLYHTPSGAARPYVYSLFQRSVS